MSISYFYLCQLMLCKYADNKKTSQRDRWERWGFFINVNGSDSVFHRNQTTEGGYEVTLGNKLGL